MSKRRLTRLVVYLVIGLTVTMVARTHRAARTQRPRAGRDAGIMRPVGDFALSTAGTGKPVALGDLSGARAVVIVFTGIGCPVSELYMSRLSELEKEYRGRGVAFLAVNANAHDTAADVSAHARDHGVAFPVFKDLDNALADQLLAERTCEAFVLDGERRLRYRGAIDDQYGRGTRKERPIRRHLAQALNAVLAGRKVADPVTSVVGCPIDRGESRLVVGRGPRVRAVPQAIAAVRKEQGARIAVGPVSYAADVAPILQARCQSCHRPRQVGPFSLLTLDDARRWGQAIREAVDELRMPPWHADPRYGRFENDRSLSARERATIVAWVDQSMPAGNLAATPAARSFPEGWSIGQPDVVFELPDTFVVPASGTVPYQRFRVPTGFTEGKWVQAAEARPGDRSVVHHLLVFVHKSSQKADAISRTGPHLASYAPGDMPAVYPPGTAKYVPAGSELMFELHYTPTGRVKMDRSSVGLVFAKGPVTRLAVTTGIPGKDLRIPPGAPAHPVRSSHTFGADVHLLSLTPHMHLRGKDFTYTAVFPDGTKEILLSVPAYDFAWQSVYRLAEPKSMPRGTRIDCLAHFDNSAENPANPDPTQTVLWGSQSWEEMMTGYIDYAEDLPAAGSVGPVTATTRRRAQRAGDP
jgi:mono/diheme cytochrome c family protein/thiol-disulfide isomerase/thioredoxin